MCILHLHDLFDLTSYLHTRERESARGPGAAAGERERERGDDDDARKSRWALPLVAGMWGKPHDVPLARAPLIHYGTPRLNSDTPSPPPFTSARGDVAAAALLQHLLPVRRPGAMSSCCACAHHPTAPRLASTAPCVHWNKIWSGLCCCQIQPTPPLITARWALASHHGGRVKTQPMHRW